MSFEVDMPEFLVKGFAQKRCLELSGLYAAGGTAIRKVPDTFFGQSPGEIDRKSLKSLRRIILGISTNMLSIDRVCATGKVESVRLAGTGSFSRREAVEHRNVGRAGPPTRREKCACPLASRLASLGSDTGKNYSRTPAPAVLCDTRQKTAGDRKWRLDSNLRPFPGAAP
jgi:hypothetical protein